MFHCSKCGNSFHDEACGMVPTESVLEEPDPDDLLRGQFTGGRRVRRVRDKAVCGVCLDRFAAESEHRRAYFMLKKERELEQNKRREEQERIWSEIRLLENQLAKVELAIDLELAMIEKNRVRHTEFDNEVTHLSHHLDAARRQWKHIQTDKSSCQNPTEKPEQELDRIQEYGHSLHYQIHVIERRRENLAKSTEERRNKVADYDQQRSDIRVALVDLRGTNLDLELRQPKSSPE